MRHIDETNLANVTLNEGANRLNQFIYNSQLYETSFGVYANIAFENNRILSIELRILNYKGTIDLEFHNDVIPKCSLESQPNNSGKTNHILVLTFELRAAISGHTTPRVLVELDASLGAITNIPTNENIFLFVERSVAPMWGLDLENNQIVLKNGVFDQEFFFRDGIRYLPRKVYDIPDAIYEGDTHAVYPENPLFQSPGFKCRNSTLLVLQD